MGLILVWGWFLFIIIISFFFALVFGFVFLSFFSLNYWAQTENWVWDRIELASLICGYRVAADGH